MARVAARVADYPGLPVDDGSRYSVRRLTAAWLLEAESVHTEKAHDRDLDTFLRWCAQERLDPLAARPTDLGQYRVWRELEGAGGRTAKAATVARALASVSSWYTHLVVNTGGRVARNPAAGVKRPKVAHHSPTAGLTSDEVDALLDQADRETASRAASAEAQPTPARHARHLAALRDRALLRLLADLGLRISEALDRDVHELSHNAEKRTLRFLAKGKEERERPLPPHTLEAIDEYLAIRAANIGVAVADLTGPLFATTGIAGTAGRLAEPNVFIRLRRLAAAAGIASAARLSPHSLRHAFATAAREAGVPLEDVQDAMGHADPRTTRRYDRDRHNLDRDPSLVLGANRALRRVAASSTASPERRSGEDEGLRP
ncbi:tyrosine recombinase XerD [Couchioplanes caeruleus subsp. azureus]|nr:tyrosine recombinase XerD [Couchioplanes caeruleus subsp. azureus]